MLRRSHGAGNLGIGNARRRRQNAAMADLTPFHIAFPVDDLDAARRFYGETLGCPEGRSAEGEWIDFDLFGHQIVAHKVEGPARGVQVVDGKGDVEGGQVGHRGVLAPPPRITNP